VNIEYFHDHARIERMLFDGAVEVVQGRLAPSGLSPGMGLKLTRPDAAKFKVYEKSVGGY
jgi:hypothetical protein